MSSMPTPSIDDPPLTSAAPSSISASTTAAPPITSPSTSPSSSTEPPPTSSTEPPPVSNSASSVSNSDTPSSSSPSQTPSSSSIPPTSSLTPSLTTLSTTSASTFQSTSIGTSNGQPVTTVITVTTQIQPGTVVTPTSVVSHGSSKSNTGAIVGGVVGGLGGLALVGVLIWFLLRRRRIKSEFDGNFDPARITAGGGGGGGGTLPQIDVDEDDGMGGRLNGGAGGGGIISPYSYTPSVPQMSHSATAPLMAGAAAAGAGAMYANNGHSQYAGASSTDGASYYPGSSSHGDHPTSPTDGGYPPTATTSSSGGYYPQNVNPYAPPMGRGPSPGPSIATHPPNTGGSSSEHSSGGYLPAGAAAAGVAGGAFYNPRSAKELEAMEQRSQSRVMNPDEPQGAYPNEQARQAYLQYGPGGGASHYGQPSIASSEGVGPSAPQRAGSAVVVHQDGGRVLMRKGEAVEEEEEQLPEIPPTYDSLVQSQGSRQEAGRQ